MRIIHIFWVVLFCYSTPVFSQFQGVIIGVNGEEEKPIYNAKIKLLGAQIGAYTNEAGEFSLVLPKQLPDTAVVIAFGYKSDTLVVTKEDRFGAVVIYLFNDQMLPEMVASFKQSNTAISKLKILHTEQINAGELRKAACCNLSESFETNASVDVNITDAVSGAKKIQMMGLDGVYTQLQLENIPFLRGLESSFGLNTMPGTWIHSMQITKGTGTVVNGYESMAGLINIEVQKPQEADVFYLNAYGNRFGRAELNVHGAQHVGKKDRISTATFLHGSGQFAEVDGNKDGFRDIPLGNNFAGLHRWKFYGDKMEGEIAVNGYVDSKNGGQVSTISNPYRVDYLSQHGDVFAKTGFFLKKPMQSIGIVYNAKFQQFNARFGNRLFKGAEQRGYINAIYDGYFGNTSHKIKSGVSGVYANFQQSVDNLNDDRTEIVPGVFAEYTYTGNRISIVAGVRADYHNLFGIQLSPRIHTKFILDEFTDLRLTGGKGWRVPNYMIDNISLLATSRQWIAPAMVRPEVAWNTGGSIVRSFRIFKRDAQWSTDFYYTYFENQLVVDRDANPEQIQFVHQQGSFSNALQSELNMEPVRGLTVRLAYKYLEVRALLNGKFQQQVMQPKHRGLINVGYQTRNRKWEFDITYNLYGASRLPVNEIALNTLTATNEAPGFGLLNAQITYNLKQFECYLGGENLTNYMQANPIIDAENPFGNYFDATRIWAPVMGANVYLGIRYAIKNKENHK